MSVLDRFDLTGRRALVTGSSRGIGRAIALALAECSADVCVHCRQASERAAEVAGAIEALGRKAPVAAADLSEAAAADRLFDEAAAALGGVDILVLNASVQVPRDWQKIAPEEFDLQMSVNLRSSLRLSQRASPGMVERHWGRILAVGSVQQCKPASHMAVYAASKSAQENLVRNLARELAPHGITVNNLAPGVIDTDRNAKALGDSVYRREVLWWIPAGRIGRAEEVAAAAVLLCSEAGSYITGANLLVDGGMAVK